MKKRKTFSATGCALKLVAGALMVGLLDGEIIEDRTYDEIKKERFSAGK